MPDLVVIEEVTQTVTVTDAQLGVMVIPEVSTVVVQEVATQVVEVVAAGPQGPPGPPGEGLGVSVTSGPNLGGHLTLPLFRVALNPRFTRPFYAVPRTSAARTASG